MIDKLNGPISLYGALSWKLCIQILLNSFFSVRTEPCFSAKIYGPRTSRLGNKSERIKLGLHLQYGLRTRLVRGSDSFFRKVMEFIIFIMK